jgi:hypothetical protein
MRDIHTLYEQIDTLFLPCLALTCSSEDPLAALLDLLGGLLYVRRQLQVRVVPLQSVVPARATAGAVRRELSVHMALLRVNGPTLGLFVSHHLLEEALLVGRAVPVRGARDAVLEGHFRVIAQELPCLGYVCAGALDVPGLLGEHLNVGGSTHAFLHQRDEVLQAEGPSVAQVDHLVAQRPVHCRDHPFHDVVDVGVVATGGAVAVLLDWLASENAIDELERRHVGASPGTVHREEPQTGAIQAVQVVKGVSQEFAEKKFKSQTEATSQS